MDKAKMFAPIPSEELEAQQGGLGQPIIDDGGTPIALSPEDFEANPLPRRTLGQPAGCWRYLDASGNILMVVRRFDRPEGGKKFEQVTFRRFANDVRRWVPKALPEPRPLYGLANLAARPDAPVMVVEGEKTADAAAALFPDHVIVTSPGGANAVGKADWSPLAGRRVLIWPDHDTPGHAYAEAASSALRAARASEVRVIQVPSDFPEGWDLADSLPSGWDRERLRGLLDRPAFPAAANDNGMVLPAGFFFNEVGLHWDGHGRADKGPLFIASPFELVAITRDAEQQGWGKLLRWKDADGHTHQWSMPAAMLAADGADYRRILLDGGLKLGPDRMAHQKLGEFLTAVTVARRALCVSRTGWHGSVFVMPDRTYGASDEHVVLQAAGAGMELKRSGTFDGWKREVAALAQGNSRVAFAMAAAFTGPLLHLTGSEGGGIHFRGPSSIGKTSTLHAAASVWGMKVGSWRTTDNAAEGAALAHNHTLLTLDEMGQADGRHVGEMAYMLTNGRGKGRMGRDAANRAIPTWCVPFISTGEVGLADKLIEAGIRVRAGQEVRVLDLPADAGAGFGVFEVLHGEQDGDRFARLFRQGAEAHQGHAASAFLEAITGRAQADVSALIRGWMSRWMEAVVPPNANGQVQRAAGRFALVAAAGEYAIELGILPWPVGHSSWAAKVCFKAWLDARSAGTGSSEEDAHLSAVRAFIATHGASRFEAVNCLVFGGAEAPPPEGQRVANRAGWTKVIDGELHYLIQSDVWRAEVCKGFDPKAVAKTLRAQGHLMLSPDRKSSNNFRIPGGATTRVYHILPSILGSDVFHRD
ncbi:DUF927 domain-containing protein [Nitrospirillum sp. BR 11828]|uniref:DUF927 domain-containing protein n=1 Tax=Nitrospirillum sp. BR 11828 TaxID=3104325 RepID=UPI002ACA95B4|nr:DUF927 domain-containing protein [Nitrospirillum sp. BR 11828]MDZ5647155.1 DUF927 domain-containing protein [Nitrospirillum sp. BR 11828]